MLRKCFGMVLEVVWGGLEVVWGGFGCFGVVWGVSTDPTNITTPKGGAPINGRNIHTKKEEGEKVECRANQTKEM